jgi:ATP-dependent RNA helicase RhlE
VHGMKFTDFRLFPELLQGLSDAGLKRPTDIQFKTIPAILQGEDVLAIAQTGTGKTAAFAIPLLDRIMYRLQKKGHDGIRAVVMVPTRELALQIAGVFETLGKHTPVKTICLFGGVEEEPQINRLAKGAELLVTTPGRLFDLASRGFISFSNVEWLVIDEADRMLDNRFIKDIRDLLKYLPQKRQTLFFSATLDAKIKKLAYSLISRNAIRIQISPRDPVTRNVRHFVAFIAQDDKRFFLERFILNHPDQKMLVFVRTKVRAERVAKAMDRVGIITRTLHGDKDQHDRIATLEDFRQGKFHILIATDVTARGLDVQGVRYVFNYDLPENRENYVHRIGRTGRGNQRGEAFSFCSPEEKPLLEDIEDLLGGKIDRLVFDKSDYRFTVEQALPEKQELQRMLKEIEEMENLQKKKKKKSG